MAYGPIQSKTYIREIIQPLQVSVVVVSLGSASLNCLLYVWRHPIPVFKHCVYYSSNCRVGSKVITIWSDEVWQLYGLHKSNQDKRRVRYRLVLCTPYLYPPPFSLPLSTTKQHHPHGQRKHLFSHEGFHYISWSFPYKRVSWSVLKFSLHRSIPYLDKEEMQPGWWGEARQGGQGGQGGPHWHWVQVHISQALNTLNFKFHYVHGKDCILHTKHFIMQTAHQGCRKVGLLG